MYHPQDFENDRSCFFENIETIYYTANVTTSTRVFTFYSLSSTVGPCCVLPNASETSINDLSSSK